MAKVPFDADAPAQRERRIKQAMAWIVAHMAGQPQPAAEMIAAAQREGHAATTLVYARQRLRIRSERRGTAWWWVPRNR